MPIFRSAVLLALAAGVAFADEPGKPVSKFKLGRDTTFVDGPLDKDGYIDYEAALNERLKGKITPESNAVVLLMQCLGPKPEGAALHKDFYKAIGIEAPADVGDYLVQYNRHFVLEMQSRDPRGFFDMEAKLKLRPWTKDDSPKHAEWLKLNQKPLEIAVEASKRKDYYFPQISRTRGGERGALLGALLPTVQKCRELALLLSFRATWHLSAGKIDDAFADVLAIHRLGRLLTRGASSIELLVGISMESIAHQADLTLLEHGRPTAKQILTYQAELEKLQPRGCVADKIGFFERFLYLDSVQYFLRTGINDLLGGEFRGRTPEQIAGALDWNAVLSMGNHHYDRMVEALRKPTRGERLQASVAIDLELGKLQKDAKNVKIDPKDPPAKIRSELTQKIGAMYVALLMPAFQKVNDAADRAGQIHRNGLLATALGAHFADHKKYPDTLAELVQKYLAKIPEDVFGAKAMIYKSTAEGYLLYSVGVNGIDDGGQLISEDSRGDDIGVRMPRK